VHRVLVGKAEGKRPLGRPRHNGKIILIWIFRKFEGVVGTGYRDKWWELVSTAKNLRVP
jgi:hypothetical protein